MFNSKKEKKPETRVDDAIKYIKRVNHSLGDAIDKKVNLNKSAIGSEISLEESGKWIFKDKREALRGLLLCQRYYLSNLNTSLSHVKPDNHWKTTSINHWKSRNRNAIDKAILLFTATSDTAANLAIAAKSAGAPPHGNDINFKLSRDEPFNIGSETCYIAIRVWLLKSGLVSYQWYLHNYMKNTLAELKSMFGESRKIWDKSDQEFGEDGQLPDVAPGHIVYINFDHQRGCGHWMVSLGGGLAAGCNNNTEDLTVDKRYSNKASLNKQFYYGYNKENAAKQIPRGVAYTFDPSKIPHRKML